MFIKSFCTVIGVFIFLLTYHVGLAFIILLCAAPQIVVSRVMANYINAFNVRY